MKHGFQGQDKVESFFLNNKDYLLDSVLSKKAVSEFSVNKTVSNSSKEHGLKEQNSSKQNYYQLFQYILSKAELFLIWTLQVQLGMVIDTQPFQRQTIQYNSFGKQYFYDPHLNVDDIYKCITQRKTPKLKSCTENSDFQRLQCNIQACIKGQISVSKVKKYIQQRKRIDIEQAVAIVLAIVPNDLVQILVKIVDYMFYICCMWTEAKDQPTFRNQQEQKMLRLIQKMQWALNTTPGESFDKYMKGRPSDLLLNDRSQIIQYLLQIRKQNSQQNKQLMLKLPNKFLETTNEYKITKSPSTQYKQGARNCAFTQKAVVIPNQVPIVVSKKRFRRVLRYVKRSVGKLDDETIFQNQVKRFIESFTQQDFTALYNTTDEVALCFSFFQYMRRLQPKVVSCIKPNSGQFLQKGQSHLVQQNTPHILSSFENAIVDYALKRPKEQIDFKALTCICTPSQVRDLVPQRNEIAQLYYYTDWVCLLMEYYINFYGKGDTQNLVFRKERNDNTNRGNIDTYNLLIDFLRDIKGKLKEKGQTVNIGPCFKFLAKDILHWNKAWADDAFADNKIPGFVDWLKIRRENNQLSIIEGLNDNSSKKRSQTDQALNQKIQLDKCFRENDQISPMLIDAN